MTKWWKPQLIRPPPSGNRKKSIQVVFYATYGGGCGESCNFLPGAQSVGGSKGVVKPSYLSDGDWMKCCEWAKDGIETASFTGNDVQRLMADQREERIRKKVQKAKGALQVSMDSIYDISVPSKIFMDDPDDKTKLELDTEVLPSTAHLSSRLGDHDANYLLSDLEFEHEPFADCNFDLKLKDDYGNDSSSRLTVLLQ